LSHGRPSGPPRRRPSSDAVRLDLLVFVEGLRTEEHYFTGWHRRYRDRVNIEIDPFRGGPLQLVEKAVEAKAGEVRDERKQRGRAHDQTWCVFDRDEHPNIPEAFALADRHGIGVAFSNPCLELWFLLHFQDQTAHVERHTAQDQAEGHLHCSKTLTELALASLIERYHDAKARAVSLDEKHAGDGSPPRSNPSSGVWQLIDVIQGA
jgi:hypothetical protein